MPVLKPDVKVDLEHSTSPDALNENMLYLRRVDSQELGQIWYIWRSEKMKQKTVSKYLALPSASYGSGYVGMVKDVEWLQMEFLKLSKVALQVGADPSQTSSKEAQAEMRKTSSDLVSVCRHMEDAMQLIRNEKQDLDATLDDSTDPQHRAARELNEALEMLKGKDTSE